MAKAKKAKDNAASGKSNGDAAITITAPRFGEGRFLIRGVAPYCQNRFSTKAREEMKAKQEAGSTAAKGRKREAKDFEKCFEQAQYRLPDGANGIPATGFRNAMIDACRMVGFTMTRARCSVFVEADGFDQEDGTPLVRFTKGEPEYHESAVRNESGVADLRPRPLWREGWEAVVRVRFDLDQFTLEDVGNLLLRAGMQIGIGEGRPFSKKSAGLGWGLFELVGDGE